MKKKQYPERKPGKIAVFNFKSGNDSVFQPEELRGKSPVIPVKKLFIATGGKPKNMMSEFYF